MTASMAEEAVLKVLLLKNFLESRSRRNLHNHKRGSIAPSLSLSTSHRPDMIEILLKRT